MKVLVAVPAYNEEDSIESVINNIHEVVPEYDYIVINDGSKDNTSGICNDINCPIINVPMNIGLSGAFGCAMKYAWKNNYDAIVQIDGDGQHNPKYIKDLVSYMQETDCDVVIGSRFVDAPASLSSLRGIGSRLITLLIKLKTHSVIHDPTSGMRLYNKRTIDLFVNNSFMEPEPHTLAYLLKNGYEICECQVKMNERKTGESYLQGYKVIRYMSRVCLSILLV